MRLPDPPGRSLYSARGIMTSPGRHAALFDGLPNDAADLVGVVQGLLVHEHLAHLYGLTLREEDRATVHIRRVEQMLEQIVARDARPLHVARPVGDRVLGNCRHFTVLLAAMLRAQGVPARARCGFGAYFVDGMFEDHWVCEYWHAEQHRWVLVDAQIDARQHGLFPIDFELTDVPRDRFLVAGQAWARCRAGTADAEKFGLSLINEAGYWWIAGNLMRDLAALNNVELLPWDTWGAMPEPQEQIDDGRLALFDRLAALTCYPDSNLLELLRLADDDRLRVPPSVHNALRDRREPI